MARGRHRETGLDMVLMNLFWEHGFESASMNDLATVTGVAKTELCATFGDKEALYAKALDYYL